MTPIVLHSAVRRLKEVPWHNYQCQVTTRIGTTGYIDIADEVLPPLAYTLRVRSLVLEKVLNEKYGG
jgi:hypothetical protein